MQEFNFSDRLAEVMIDGKVYTFDPANPEYLDEVVKVTAKLKSFKPDDAPDAAMKFLSRELRDVVGAVLGKAAQDEIFANRKPNIVNEVKLINTLMAARAESGIDAEIDKLVSSIGGPTIDD